MCHVLTSKLFAPLADLHYIKKKKKRKKEKRREKGRRKE